MKTYSTKRVARMVGIHWTTLHRWLAAKKVRSARSTPMDGRTLWRWTETDVKRIRKYKAANYRKGRGRKKKAKK